MKETTALINGKPCTVIAKDHEAGDYLVASATSLDRGISLNYDYIRDGEELFDIEFCDNIYNYIGMSCKWVESRDIINKRIRAQ